MSFEFNYQTQLRAAQAAFRNKNAEKARKIAIEILKHYEGDPDVLTFLTAVNKYLRSMMNRSIRERDYESTMRFAYPLLGDADFGASAQAAFLGAARAQLSPQSRAALIYSVSGQVEVCSEFWEELAGLLVDLPATTENIEMGFEVLVHLPGHAVGLDGLHELIDRHRQGISA